MKRIWFLEFLTPLRRRITLTRLLGAITVVLAAMVLFFGWKNRNLASHLAPLRKDRAALAERCQPLRPMIVHELETAAHNLSMGHADRVHQLDELQVVLERANAAVTLCFPRDEQHDTIGLGSINRIDDELFRIAASRQASRHPSMPDWVVHSRPVSREDLEDLARVIDEGWAKSRAGGPWLGATRTSLNEP